MTSAVHSSSQPGFAPANARETEKANRTALATGLMITALALAVIGTGVCLTATVVCFIVTIAAGATGFGAPAIIPGVCLTILFGTLTVSAGALSVYLINKV